MLKHRLVREYFHPNNFVEGDRLISLDQFANEVSSFNYVLVGEDHRKKSHMDALRAILERLHKRNPKLILGMEHFLTQEQPLIDTYLASEIDLESLAKRGYLDSERYELRRDVLEYARVNGIKIKGLMARSEKTFGVPKEEMHKLTDLDTLRGTIAHDDYMSQIVKGIEGQVLLPLGDWHTYKDEEIPNMTKKLPKGSFSTAVINDVNFSKQELDGKVIAYSTKNPNYRSWDYMVIRVAR